MDKMIQTMIGNMPEKTGKPLEQWIELLKAVGFSKHSEAVNYLKNTYGITYVYAKTLFFCQKKNKLLMKT